MEIVVEKLEEVSPKHPCAASYAVTCPYKAFLD